MSSPRSWRDCNDWTPHGRRCDAQTSPTPWLARPLAVDEIAERYRGDESADAVLDSLRGRVIAVTHRGRAMWAAVEDAA